MHEIIPILVVAGGGVFLIICSTLNSFTLYNRAYKGTCPPVEKNLDMADVEERLNYTP